MACGACRASCGGGCGGDGGDACGAGTRWRGWRCARSAGAAMHGEARQERPLRFCMLALVFVGIGAVTSTVAAWGLSLRFQLATGEGTSPGVFGPTIPADGLSLFRACVTLAPSQETVFWRESPPSSRVRSYSIVSGWPALSLAAFRDNERFHARVSPGCVLPLLPLSGFLVDTAFWGGAAFVVWSVPSFVRRRVRRRRGRCVRCGYELVGVAVCPECGTSSGVIA